MKNHILSFSDPNQRANTTVIVGMSGGVDSSVVAYLLKEQGFNVIGMFMKNWEEQDENGVCQASKEFADVVAVCEQIDIPYYSVEFVKEYKEQVFSHFLKEYKAGHTPNPDILCNREIKFKVFLEKALELGADYLATGHYAMNPVINGHFHLAKGIDPGKDQSYFLYTLKENILSKVLFPLGHLNKSEVREIANKAGLSTASKKDSTGICFIGERNFRKFLSNYIESQKGNFETLEGEIVGSHIGCCYYTLGQRKGLGLGGPGEPWYVVGKDVDRNVVVVERGDKHPAMYTDWLSANEITWVNPDFKPKLPFKCRAKLRYRQVEQECTINKIEGDYMEVTFSSPQRAVTPRQSIVFYQDEICLGGAMIISPGESYYELGKPLS